MAILRPSYTSIFSALYTDISTGLGNQPLARYSILGAFGRALARAMDSVYGYVDNLFLNSVPWSATGTSLDAWAALWGIIRLAPNSASGSATFTFNAAATIPAGSVFVGANSVTYTNAVDVVAAAAGTETVSLTTTSQGAATNMAPGLVVTLTSPIANVVPGGAIITMTGGADAETDAALFARAQEARSNPPQGGAQGDYVEWALASSGSVTRAWVQPSPAQPGNVIVYVMCDGNANNNFPVGTNGTAISETRGTAGTGDQLTVANYIYQPYRRPVTAFVEVVAPTANPINVTITACSPNTTASQAAITQAIKDRFVAIGSPLGMNVYESDIAQAIQGQVTSFNLTVPNATTAIPLGSVPTLGTITIS